MVYIMVRKNILLFSVIIICILIQNSSAAENNFGIVKAWCNQEPATVNNFKVKINEPIIVKVEITSKIEGFIDVILEEPGPTKSYDVISGPTDFDDYITYDVTSSWSKEETWVITPNGKWTNGIAPINLYVQLNKDIDDVERVQITIANPYILDEQYSGSTSKPTPDPKSTDQPPSSEGSPGFGLVAALMGVAIVVLTGRKLH